MRQYNLVGRGQKEPLVQHLDRIKRKMGEVVSLGDAHPLSRPVALYDAEVGCLEIREGTLYCIAPDGQTVLGTLNLGATMKDDNVPSIGGLGPMRLMLVPMEEIVQDAQQAGMRRGMTAAADAVRQLADQIMAATSSPETPAG